MNLPLLTSSSNLVSHQTASSTTAIDDPLNLHHLTSSLQHPWPCALMYSRWWYDLEILLDQQTSLLLVIVTTVLPNLTGGPELEITKSAPSAHMRQ